MPPDEWIDLLGAPERRPDPVDWDAVKGRVGTALPSDFVHLADAYPPLIVGGYVRILHPTARAGFMNWMSTAPKMLRALRRQPGLRVHPDSPGLLPWGMTVNGDHCLWYTGGEPDQWTVMITDLRQKWSYDGTFSSFIRKFLTGELRCPLFPDDVPGGSKPFQEP